MKKYALLVLALVGAACTKGSAKPATNPAPNPQDPAVILISDTCLGCHETESDGRPALSTDELVPELARRAVTELLAMRMPPPTSPFTVTQAERRRLVGWYCARTKLGQSACDDYIDALDGGPRAPVPSTYQAMSNQLTGEPGELTRSIETQMSGNFKPRITSLTLDPSYIMWAGLSAAVRCSPGDATKDTHEAATPPPTEKAPESTEGKKSVADCIDDHLDVLFRYVPTKKRALKE